RLAGDPTTIDWRPMSDNQPSLSISSLALDPNDLNGNTLWAGTGSLSSGFNYGGSPIGLLKTTDGGQTWTVLGGTGLSGQRVVSVVPTKVGELGQVVLVAALDGNGVMRSNDGGRTFQPVNAVDQSGNHIQLTGQATDLIADPVNR